MTALIGFYWYGLVIAACIGLFTGWWTWGGRSTVAAPIEIDPDDALIDGSQDDPVPPPADPRPIDRADAPDVAAQVAANDVETLASEIEDAPADVLGPVIAAAQTVEEPEPDAEPESALSAAANDETDADGAPVEEIAVGEPASGKPNDAPDDLLMIKGIDPQLDALLRSLGVQRFEQIAGWMPEDIERIDGELGIYKGRILRDEWIGQARLLARGDKETFNQRYGHLS